MPGVSCCVNIGSTRTFLSEHLRVIGCYVMFDEEGVRVANRPDGDANDENGRFEHILGISSSIRRILSIVQRVAESEVSILLEGETGTGKTLLANTIHQNSKRCGGPFVVVDCSAIPPTLIESELFGHEKGSFTGAHTTREGAFQSARGGTVFLDEIGELLPELQPKLLRALEERVIKRIGAQKPTRLDIRLIAATNRDLRDEVAKGNFRSDLYYRLNTVKLRIPPLRERPEDIPLLVSRFYSQFSIDDSIQTPTGLIEHCLRQRWPGNVRELRSAVERAVLLGDPDPPCSPESHQQSEINRSYSPFGEFDPAMSYRETKERIVRMFERWYVRELVERHHGNLSQAARAARMDRNHLRTLMRRHKISIDTSSSGNA